MFVGCDLLTDEIAELLLLTISSDEMNLNKVKINNPSDIRATKELLLNHILDNTTGGILLMDILCTFVRLIHKDHSIIFEMIGLYNIEEIIYEARMSLLNNEELNEYLEYQACLLRHNLNSKDLK
jgi:hypothetical protein